MTTVALSPWQTERCPQGTAMPNTLLEAAASPQGAGTAVPEGLRWLWQGSTAPFLPPAHPFSFTDLTVGQDLDPTALHPAL